MNIHSTLVQLIKVNNMKKNYENKEERKDKIHFNIFNI